MRGAPAVFYSQKDISQVVIGLDSDILGIAGNAKWGPADVLTPVDDLGKFVQMFGKPTTPSETAMFYQMYLWFQLGRSAYVVRPQGESKFGGVEALVDTEIFGISASLDNLPSTPSGANVIGIYSKYAGVHDEGDIFVYIYDVDGTAGTFKIRCGVKKDTAGTALDTSDEWYEEHEVSVITGAKDESGRSLYIEQVLDRDSQLIAGRAKDGALVSDVPAESTGLVALANQAYTAATASDIATAYKLFESLDAVTIDILIPGSFDDTVLNQVVASALTRGDCFYILSPNVNETWTLDGISGGSGWVSNITTLSENGAAYAMYYKIKDTYNDKDVFVPCAGGIAGAYAYNDVVGEKYDAPAGSKRGIQLNVDLGHTWTGQEQDTLYDRNINFVKKSPRYGVIIEGQKTMKGGTSALSRVNVARLMLKIKRDLTYFLQDYLYEINNDRNRTLIFNGIDAYLDGLGEGLQDKRVICDTTNNTPTVIDNNELVVTIYVKPARVAEYIKLNAIITSSGVDFDDLIAVASL